MAETFERQARILEGTVSDGAAFEQARRHRRLPQRNGTHRLSRHQRPRIEQGREVDHVVVEGVGDVATLECTFEEKHVHANVLAGGDHLAILGQHLDDLGQHLSDTRRFRPQGFVVTEDRRGLGRDTLGAGADAPLGLGGLCEAGVGHDDSDLGEIVDLDIEATELTIHKCKGEFGTHRDIGSLSWRAHLGRAELEELRSCARGGCA